MAKFTVRRYVDAYFISETEVEASTPEEAASLASKDEDKYKWSDGETVTFDARYYAALDENGNEIEESQTGDRI